MEKEKSFLQIYEWRYSNCVKNWRPHTNAEYKRYRCLKAIKGIYLSTDIPQKFRIYFNLTVEKRKILTHGGTFHGDEVFATAWLIYSIGIDLKMVERTFQVSDEDIKNPDVLVYDIGGDWKQTLNVYDHHQGGEGLMRASGIPFASFGMVFDDFPKSDMSDFVEDVIRQKLVYPIDFLDNGLGETGVDPSYSLTAVISSFNPLDGRTDVDDCFQKAVRFAYDLLLREIALAEKQEKDFNGVINSEFIDGKIIVMPECYTGWQRVMINEFSDEFLYAIYPGLRGGYMLQCIPKEIDSFETRKSLPKDWWGLRDSELQEKCGIEDAMFVHPNGFIGGAESVEGCLKMASLAIKE